jgi:hypothetical protein
MRTGVIVALLFALGGLSFAQEPLTLSGRVSDETGGVLAGAAVQVTNTAGFKKAAVSDKDGVYKVRGLPPGTYIVSVEKTSFSPWANGAVEVKAGTENVLDVQMQVSLSETVTVEEDTGRLTLDSASSPGAIVLKQEDIENLPDDPDELAEVLQALAGPASGPNGGQFFIDGFSGGRLPAKSSIREIRMNNNPFSAEFERMGLGGRIEILTRAGTDKMRGDVSFNFNDDMLNARNPFAPARPPYQRREWRASLSGPIVPKKASFSFSAERSDVDENDIVNATVLDPSLNIVTFNQTMVAGSSRTEVNPRLDFAINPNHTLVARYEYGRNDRINAGVGDFSLPSRAYDSAGTDHQLQITETAVIRGKVINEVRFQLTREEREQLGDNTIPTLSVAEAFVGGGPQVGRSFNHQTGWELGNTTSWTHHKHAFRAGVRVRGVDVDDVSRNNFGGSITFAGGVAPVLDANDEIVRDAFGNPVLDTITTIERYRRTLLFTERGLSAEEVRRRGGGATQLRINGGDPEALVDQLDFGVFMQDDWRVSNNLTLSLGLRYENQTNIHSPLNLAPRLGFAWAPPNKNKQAQPKTVVRGGAGVFYERFSQGLTLDANRANGSTQQQYVITNPAVLDLMRFSYDAVTGVPSADTLTEFSVPQAVRVVSPEVEAPYRLQGSISVDRQLPAGLRASVGFVGTLTRRELRSRNINAPLPSGERPLGNNTTVYQYESTGRASQKQLFFSLNRAGRKIMVYGNYSLTWAYSDTDGAGTFPADQYDLSDEWGRASFAARHTAFIGGNVTLPWGIRVGPRAFIRSGSPFNITTGRDNNGDTMFTDRPAFATDPDKPGVVQTKWGLLDPNPTPGQKIIPRNHGTGPGSFNVGLNVSKTIGFGGRPSGPPPVPEGTGGDQGPRGPIGGVGGGEGRGPGGGGGGRGGGGRGGFGGRFGGDGGGASNSRYNLSLSLRVDNLLNHTNKRPPVGSLSSQLFGESTGTMGFFGGARRITLNMRLGF